MKPRLLDLFCGAGGCTKGYQRAGFYVVGVDIVPQPNYCGDEFVQGDVLEVFDSLWWDHFDAIHASPPCQAYTSMRHLGNGAGVGAEMLIEPTRDLLLSALLPYVIENVVGAKAHLRTPTRICASALGLQMWRHRWFETNWTLLSPGCFHTLAPEPIAVYGDHPENCRGTKRVRRARTLVEGQEAMGIDWMPWKTLTQAIPPAYTELIGHQLMQHLQAVAA